MGMLLRSSGLVLFIILLQAIACMARSEKEGRPLLRDPSPNVSVPPLTHIVDSLGVRTDAIRFEVDKSDRLFKVVADGRVLKTYRCVLGEVPEGDKMMQGDRRTPEGVFGIRSKRMHDKWHGIDYPNAESVFAQRQRDGSVPANADIGGEIGIHGVPAGKDHWVDAGVDWTWGCIALKNPDMDEIYPYIKAGGTMITIVP